MSNPLRVTRLFAKDDPFGTELIRIALHGRSLRASGVALSVFEPAPGEDLAPYRVDYELTTTEEFVTSSLSLRVQGHGWARQMELRRSTAGVWSCSTEVEGDVELPAPGGDFGAMADALDCDLAFSPLTNSMPVLRHRILDDCGPVDIAVAWVSLPDLGVHRESQRYRFVRRDGPRRVVRFESLESPFVADIVFDERGIVIDYPEIARAIA
jgi:uncharacterized protein